LYNFNGTCWGFFLVHIDTVLCSYATGVPVHAVDLVDG